jgi:inosose dehydratase
MSSTVTRRTFSKALAGCVGAAAAGTFPMAASTRRLSIGHTCITWGTFPNAPDTLQPALEDIASLGYSGFETFPQVLEALHTRGELTPLIERYRVPLISGYIFPNVLDPAERKTTLAEVVRLATLLKQLGGTYLVIQAHNSVRNIPNWDFREHRANIVASLNEYGKAVTDLGLGVGLHQHTGTAVDTQDQVYAVMEAVDTRYMKFAPDVGQLQKAGADAAKVVHDFREITTHMHLKDWSGWDHFGGYCPLGQGKVDLKTILETMEQANPGANIMVELDPSRKAPYTPRETAEISRKYLEQLGYTFRTAPPATGSR